MSNFEHPIKIAGDILAKRHEFFKLLNSGSKKYHSNKEVSAYAN